MPTQNVNLTDELESFVKKQVTGGFYNNASEVHRAALASMARTEEVRQARIERLKAEAQKGVDAIEAGEFQVTENEEQLDALLDHSYERAMQRLKDSDAERVV